MRSSRRAVVLASLVAIAQLSSLGMPALAAEGPTIEDLERRISELEKRAEKTPEPTGGHWIDWLTLGVHLRARNETRLEHDELSGGPEDKDNFTLLRARLSVDARPVDEVRAFVQIQASREFGTSALTPSPFGPGNVPIGVSADDEGLAIHQAFGDLNFDNLTLRVGRHEMRFGDERLVGTLGWSNRGRAFDGASLIQDTTVVHTQAFFHVVERRPGGTPAPFSPSADSYFTGVNARFKQMLNGIEAYFLAFLDDDGAATATQDGNLFIYTAGLYTKDMPLEGAGYEFEGAFQLGENDAREIVAFAVHAAAGYGLGGALKPRFILEYNVASGDDGTGNDNAFRNLFPTNHNKYGYIDFMSWSNMHNLRAHAGVTLFDALAVAADYHLFVAYDPEGAIGAGAAALPASGGRSDRVFGHEADLLLAYPWKKFVKMLAGYSLFIPGDMHAGDEPVHFGYLQFQIDV